MLVSPQIGYLLETGLWNAKVLLGKTWQAAQEARMICRDPASLLLRQHLGSVQCASLGEYRMGNDVISSEHCVFQVVAGLKI